MSSNRQLKKQKPRNRKKQIKLNPDHPQQLRVVRIRDIMPPRIVTTLKYIVNRNLVNIAGTTASMQMNANGLYDVDPALASTAVPGFVEFGAFYQRYKVLKCISKCTFINRETFPVVINLGFEALAFAANGKTISYYEMHNQKTQLVPASQTARGITLSMAKSAIEVVGDAVTTGSLNFTGSPLANPLALWYTSISASTALIGAGFAAGIAIRWELEFIAEFYELQLINA